MAEFRTEYYTPMDRGYHERLAAPVSPHANIEEPVLPINRLGQTVPEHNQIKGTNILQNVQAAIRGGTGSMQIVFMTPVESAMGGRPKAYGEEVRQAIREVALANETMITGMELPTSLTNLSGYDQQHGIVDEEKRRRDLEEVKETIRFAADTARGGSVDIVSFEYDRPLKRANWLTGDKATGIAPDRTAQEAFRQAMAAEEKRAEMLFVDKDSGAIARIPIREGIPMFVEKGTWRKKKAEEGEMPDIFRYEDFEGYAKHVLKKKHVTYEEVAAFVKDSFMEEQINMTKGQQGYYAERLRSAQREMEKCKKIMESVHASQEDKEDAKKGKEFLEKQIIPSDLAGLEAQRRAQKEHEERQKRLVPMESHVIDKSEASYAEAAVSAMNLQHEYEKAGKPMKPLCVGPELGWPQSYGSHPREFVEIIIGARAKMQQQLIKQGFSPAQAKEEAKAHIKGTFDTSHMGMWLQNFHPELPWQERLDNFNKWFNEQINWLAEVNRKEQVIGTIQAVDSAGPGHGHLPPGQGIFPVKEAVETLVKKGGFDGYVVSEGHEEERFGEGRIFLKTWEHFNAPLATSYAAGMPGQRRWGEVAHGYMGRTYSPMFMFGAYAPSNEFKLWSEVPLE